MTAAQPVRSAEASAALANADRMMSQRPDLAEAQARQALQVAPDDPQARLLLAAALSRQGRAGAALEALEPLSREQPKWAAVHIELGRARGELGDGTGAIAALRAAAALRPEIAETWRMLAEQYRLAGKGVAADECQARYILATARDPALLSAAQELVEGRLDVAEQALRRLLRMRHKDVAGLRLLAEVMLRAGRFDEAANLLSLCLELSPSFDGARQAFAATLLKAGRAAEALEQADRLLAAEPRNPSYRSLHAAALAGAGRDVEAAEAYGALLKEFPQQPGAWRRYGESLLRLGRSEEARRAFETALSLQDDLDSGADAAV